LAIDAALHNVFINNLDNALIQENFRLLDAFHQECLLEWHLGNVKIIFNDHSDDGTGQGANVKVDESGVQRGMDVRQACPRFFDPTPFNGSYVGKKYAPFLPVQRDGVNRWWPNSVEFTGNLSINNQCWVESQGGDKSCCKTSDRLTSDRCPCGGCDNRDYGTSGTMLPPRPSDDLCEYMGVECTRMNSMDSRCMNSSNWEPNTCKGYCEDVRTGPVQKLNPGPSMLGSAFSPGHNFADWCDGDEDNRGVFETPIWDGNIQNPDWYMGGAVCEDGSHNANCQLQVSTTCNQFVWGRTDSKYDLYQPYKNLYDEYGGQQNPGSYYGKLFAKPCFPPEELGSSSGGLAVADGFGAHMMSTAYWVGSASGGQWEGWNICQRCNYCVGVRCRAAINQLAKLSGQVSKQA